MVGITLLFLGAATVIKIFRGSKINFAYTITALTCAYGLTFVGTGVLDFYLNNEIRLYFRVVFDFFYYWLSIQGWIFAIQYLISSVRTGETTSMTEN